MSLLCTSMNQEAQSPSLAVDRKCGSPCHKHHKPASSYPPLVAWIPQNKFSKPYPHQKLMAETRWRKNITKRNLKDIPSLNWFKVLTFYEVATCKQHSNVPAGLAHLAFRTLPARTLKWCGTDLQTGIMIMLSTTCTV